MKRILIATAFLLATTANAADWMASTQDVKGGVWSQWVHSSFDDYMAKVISDCHAAMIIQPYAVKIRFPDGKEQLFLCDDIRKKHPR